MLFMCKGCGGEKPDSAFYKNKGARMGKCKECVKADVRAHREKNLEAIRAYDRARGQLPHRKEIGKANAHKYKRGNMRLSHPEHSAARDMMNNCLRDGIIRKPVRCERCAATDCQLNAHHDDYQFPLAVTWLCTACHGEVHREENEQRRAENAA